jgi:hypothetical protein
MEGRARGQQEAGRGAAQLNGASRGERGRGRQRGTHRWQKPRISFALYIMSAAISMRRMVYMSSYLGQGGVRVGVGAAVVGGKVG